MQWLSMALSTRKPQVLWKVWTYSFEFGKYQEAVIYPVREL